jgi:hypothetical protein
LLFFFAWTYEKVTNEKNISTIHPSSSGYRSSNLTCSKRGRCRYCGTEVIVDELPDSAADQYLQVSALCFSLLKLGRPSFTLPQEALQVFGSSRIQPMEIASVAYEYQVLHVSMK